MKMMFKNMLKTALLSGSGGAVGGLAGLKISGMEFNGSGVVLVVVVGIVCVTFLLALLILTKRTDFTAVLTSWATRKPPGNISAKSESVESG